MATESNLHGRTNQNWETPEGHPHLFKRRRESFISWLFPGQPLRDDNIVVYDPLERRLWVDNKENIKVAGRDKYVRVPTPGTDTRIQIQIEVGEGDKKATVPVGTVELTRLGKNVKSKRKRGEIRAIYVLGKVPEWCRAIHEEDERCA